jgi:hypothetical protein
MKFRQLQNRSSIRIRVSGVEMSALRKIVELGLFALEGEEANGGNPLTTSERKAVAYWKGNPFKDFAKPRRRPRKPVQPKEASLPVKKPRASPRAALEAG